MRKSGILLFGCLAAASAAHAGDITISVKQPNGRGIHSFVSARYDIDNIIEMKRGEYKSSKIRCETNVFKVKFNNELYVAKQNNIACVKNQVNFIVQPQDD